jgi:D-glycero-alpha-D-manno-heptose-7-phosphate kinase
MIISQTPLRISFVGGGTDLKSFYERTPGMVISSAIDKYLFVILNERFDDKVYVNYVNKEIVTNVNDIKHDLVRETLLKSGIKQGIEVTMLADIPSEGSGLGSSSSLTVGLLNAMYQFVGKQVTAEQLAREACEIEIDILKKPIGKQDQYIAAYGGIRKFVFNTDDSVTVKSLSFSRDCRIRLGSNILLYFTDITRKADSILKEQKRNTSSNFESLSDLAGLVPVLEKEFEKLNFDSLGFLLKKNWDLKKKLASGITKPEIEKMVDLAMNAGASGVKIAGAGGGGFLMSYITREKQDIFRKAMGKYTELPFMLDPFGSRIIFNMRRYSSKITI